jgi:hypothetical protein
MSDGSTAAVGVAEDGRAVPTPVPPDDHEAWYAPGVVAQYEVSPGVVATIRDTGGDEFAYSIREPGLGPEDRDAMARIRDHFTAVQ